ncbi:MAG: YjfB family protein [Clostridiales bacterium]|nr:YjfB family protein [Clostridiales bacterium]
MDMGIAALSIQMSQAKTQQQHGVSMLKKTMDQMEQTGAQLVEMIQETQPQSGGGIDIKL